MRASVRRFIRLEPLEARRMLTCSKVTLEPETGVLEISGTHWTETVNVSQAIGGMIHVRHNVQGAVDECDFASADVQQIVFRGRGGDDTFRNETAIDSTAYGGDGTDLLLGGSGNDFLYGDENDDVLKGRGGNDYLDGGRGQDQLNGGAGDDVLRGGMGDDVLLGGDGNDDLGGQAGNDLLDGGSGDDVLSGFDGNDTLLGGDGNDRLLGEAGDDLLEGGAGADYLEGGSGDDLQYGGAGGDTLDGGTGNDRLYGGQGHDKLQGGAGDDLLEGGHGDDELHGFDGIDQLFGGAGNDLLDGGRDGDHLVGGSGDDRLVGGADDDFLDGGDDHDALDGGTGNDFVLGGGGNDSAQGGAGDDFLSGGDGDDLLIGFDGNDVLAGGAGNDVLHGEDGNDTLYGNHGDDELLGGGGDDVLGGGEGHDKLDGGVGNDVLAGDQGNDHLNGGVGNDLLLGGDGDDSLLGSEDDDMLLGGSGNDSLDGSSGNDALVGQDGDDFLEAHSGNDALIGGNGKDVLYGRTGEDLVIGGRTSYDQDLQRLQEIREIWTSSQSYEARIQALEDPRFSAYLQSEQTVFDDYVADDVFGNEDLDWLFLTGAMHSYSPAPSITPHSQSGGHHHHHQQQPTAPSLPQLEGFDFLDALDRLDVAAGEQIHTVVHHGTDPSRLGEHLSLFELIRYDQVSHIALTSGDWTAPSTWQHGHVPSAGANVLIPVGIEVTVDTIVPAELRTLRVDGTLRFDPHRDTELRADTIAVAVGGLFEMGTAQQPISADVTARLVIADRGPIDRSWDPYGLSRGLISHGRFLIHGAAKTSHLPVLMPPAAGTHMLILSGEAIGWRAGDRIVVPGVTAGGGQDEVREVVAVNGQYVWLNAPLQYDHIGPDGSLPVHVANLTRNAAIESENAALDRRGHVMFMHTRAVDIRYAGFYHLGRSNKLEVVNDPVVDESWTLKEGTGTNPRGRYAVHFHRNGAVNGGNPSVVHGSVVADSPGWGYVNHSSFVEMTDNVSYDVDGSGFVTEAGDEIGSFRNNIAIHSRGSGEEINSRVPEQDFGHEGNGFWFQGTGIAVTGNVAAGHPGNAFVFYTRGLNHGRSDQQMFLSENLDDPSIAGGAEMIDTRHVPMKEFRDNVGYASATGLFIRYHLRDAPHARQSIFEKSAFWNNSTGVALPYSNNVVLRNLRIIRPFSLDGTVGVDINLLTQSVTYDNLTVVGYRRGIDAPSRGETIIRGGHYNNMQNILIRAATLPNRSVKVTGNIRFGAFPPEVLGRQSQYAVYMVPQFEHDVLNAAAKFNDSVVILDYGRFSNARVYSLAQAPGFVPFATPSEGAPAAYAGLTNQQLWNRYGMRLSGTIAPAGAVEVPGVYGLVWPAPRGE